MARENSRWGYRRIQGELVGRSGWFDRRPAMTVGPFLGDGHPSTLKVMSSLSTDLYDLGEYEQARILDEENLQWSRRVLGEDHPHTLICIGNLVADLGALGRHAEADALDER